MKVEVKYPWFLLFLFFSILFFFGTPDLTDALIYWLSGYRSW
jgi:hypothetical protein